MPLVQRTGKYIANDEYTNISIIEMNKKTLERIAVFVLAAFLIGYFIYQVAYASSYTNYLNGTAIRTYDNGTTVRETPPQTYNLDIGNTTWLMHNSTSGSVSTITFHEVSWNNITWVRDLHGYVHKGIVALSPDRMAKNDRWIQPWGPMNLCNVGDTYPCALLNTITISPDHLEFKDPYGGIIDLKLLQGAVVCIVW